MENERDGFTLIELLITIAIIGMLMAVLTPSLIGVMTNAKNVAAEAYVNQLVKSVEIIRGTGTLSLPPPQTCLSLMEARTYPRSIDTCTYTPDTTRDDYALTVVGATGKTFLYAGGKITVR